MRKITQRLPNASVSAIAFLLIGSSNAVAQGQQYTPERAFISVNAGMQPQRYTIHTADTFSIYDESGAVTSTLPIRNGAVFDIGGGYRIGAHFALAASFSSFGRSSSSTLTASIPDPIFFGQAETVTSQSAALDHSERGVHVQAVWFIPVTDKIDVALSAGPSFIHVTQQVPSVALPPGATGVSMVSVAQAGFAKGANVGVDGSYMFSPRYGVGVFVRYAGGSINLPATSDIAVGGLQSGLGFRIRL
jgi:hypothetical protein